MRCEEIRLASLKPLLLADFAVHLLGKGSQHSSPSIRMVEHFAKLLATLAMALEAAVLQFNQPTRIGLGRKPDTHFARFREVGIELPIRTQVSGKGHAARRIPGRHRAPVARIAEGADLSPVFEHHAGHGKASGVGEGKGGAGYAQAGGNLGSAPMKLECGSSARLADDLDLQPAHAVADARSQGLGSRFLGGKSGGKALGGLALAQAVGLLRGGVDAVEKPLAVTIHGLLDAPDLHQIDSGADDHAMKVNHFAFVVLAHIPGAWRQGFAASQGVASAPPITSERDCPAPARHIVSKPVKCRATPEQSLCYPAPLR